MMSKVRSRSGRFPNFSTQLDSLHQLRLKKEESGVTVLDLTESNPTQLDFIYPKDIFSHFISSEYSWKYEPIANGLQSARQSIAKYYKGRYPTSSCYDDINQYFLTSGTSESYSILLKCITNPGDEILVQTPGYPLLQDLAKLELVDSIPFHNLEDIPDLVSSKTRAISIVQPNNPTGSIINKEEWNFLIDLAIQYNLSIIIDEVFSDYCSPDNPLPLMMSDKISIFTLNGISKMAGLPSWKLAWIHVQSPPELREVLYPRLEWISDSFLSVHSLSQEMLPLIIESRHMIQNQIRNRIKRNYGIIQSIFQGKIDLLDYNQSGWYLKIGLNLLTDPISDEEFAKKLLIHENVFVYPGTLFGYGKLDSKLVMSLIVPEDRFQIASESIESLLPK